MKSKGLFKITKLVPMTFVLIAGCGGGTAPSANNPPPDPLGAIVVNIFPQTASVQVGHSTQFNRDGSERFDEQRNNLGSLA
jgi:hypothetical protein